jgi:hypothetical protein
MAALPPLLLATGSQTPAAEPSHLLLLLLVLPLMPLLLLMPLPASPQSPQGSC